MKKTISIALAAMFFAITTPEMGCTTGSKSNPIPSVNLPDISNFALQSVSTFVAGASALITVASTSLADGSYTITYDLSGANVMAGLTANITVSGDKATFSTPNLMTAGNMTVTIRSITNSSGESSSITSNNVKSFTDSTGIMTWTFGGTTYTAKHVMAYHLGGGGTLEITATIWEPLHTCILYVDDYTGVATVCNFNKGLIPPKGAVNYAPPGKLLFGQHGTISVTVPSPTLTGTFSFTNDDSSKVTAGTFKVKAP